MKIERVTARNVLSFSDKGIAMDLADYNLIVGPNASGKTNLLRVLSYPIAHLTSFGSSGEVEFYRLGSPTFEFQIDIELGEAEAEALANFIACSMLSEAVTVASNENQLACQRIAFEIASVLRPELVNAFQHVSLLIKGEGKQRQPPFILLKAKIAGQDRFLKGSLITNSSAGKALGAIFLLKTFKPNL